MAHSVLLAAVLSGVGAAIIATTTTLIVRRLDSRKLLWKDHETEHAVLQAKLEVQMQRILDDLNSIGRKVAGIDAVVTLLAKRIGEED